jgi:hypothetical protein
MPTRGTGVCTHVAIDELHWSAWRGMARKLRLYRGVARACGVRVGVEHPCVYVCVRVCVVEITYNYLHDWNASLLQQLIDTTGI